MWYPECEELKSTLDRISCNLQHILIAWCDVSEQKEIVQHFEVSIVPYILLMHVSGLSNYHCLINVIDCVTAEEKTH